ncbi:protein kinase [Hydrogenophaga sp. 5NK40-0174]|uniref:protein kinase domain-containing protein n=1 Tax=Hydrogenophaga sp. 5NK40-0174 TaxID=3127649 RepID=UPI0031049AA6
MNNQHKLRVRVGQYSDKGRKLQNQDFHGLCVPDDPQLTSKGIAIAIADGISSSKVSHVAAESAVASFLADYYCTSEAWSVKRSAERVISAANSWLHSQTQQSQYRFDKDRGYVCTLSVMVLRQNTAHLFHVGDSRIYKLHERSLEQLTDDHRVWLGGDQSYLARAMGAHSQLEIDHRQVDMATGDVFVLATDGVYEHVDAKLIHEAIASHPEDLDAAAKHVVEQAYAQGSEDNLTIQIVAVEAAPGAGDLGSRPPEAMLAMPPTLQPRMRFEGYTIVRQLHQTHRSQLFLATDDETGVKVVIKVPSTEMKDKAAELEHLQMEEWIARRVDNLHLLKPHTSGRERKHLFVAMEYIEGQTLEQWMTDHPAPSLEEVRSIIEQTGKGLQALHRMEMIHQDIRPANVMIDQSGTVKIIDYGTVRVAGLGQVAPEHAPVPGFVQYAAPEYFTGDGGSAASDLFSLAVMSYEMLSGRLPYGLDLAKTRTRGEQRKLTYRSVVDDNRPIPLWLDGVFRKALHIDPFRRHQEISEFTHELRHPPEGLLHARRPPLAERHPVLLWKGISLTLLLLVLLLLSTHPWVREL